MTAAREHAPVARQARGNGETTLFAHNGFLITDRTLVAHGRRYDVVTFDRVWKARGPGDAAVAATGYTTVVVLFLALIVSWERPASTVYVAGAVAAAGTAAVAFLLVRHAAPRPYELWAEIGQLSVLLVATRDATTYDPLCRALIRALERSD
jgi:hypothetical protein